MYAYYIVSQKRAIESNIQCLKPALGIDPEKVKDQGLYKCRLYIFLKNMQLNHVCVL